VPVSVNFCVAPCHTLLAEVTAPGVNPPNICSKLLAIFTPGASYS